MVNWPIHRLVQLIHGSLRRIVPVKFFFLSIFIFFGILWSTDGRQWSFFAGTSVWSPQKLYIFSWPKKSFSGFKVFKKTFHLILKTEALMAAWTSNTLIYCEHTHPKRHNRKKSFWWVETPAREMLSAWDQCFFFQSYNIYIFWILWSGKYFIR